MDKKLEQAKSLGIDVESFKAEDGTVDEAKLDAAIQEKSQKDDDKDVDYYKSEMKKAIDKRDSVKADLRNVKAEMEELKKSLTGNPSKEELEKTKAELEELRAFKQELTEKEEAEKLKAMNDVERQKALFDKQLNDLTSQYDSKFEDLHSKFTAREEEIKARDTKIRELRQHQLKNEILVAAKNNKAYNPEQICRLVERDFTFDDTTQKFHMEEKDRNGKISKILEVDEYIKEFLSDPVNENLVESDITDRTKPSPGKDVPPHSTIPKKLTPEQRTEMELVYKTTNEENYRRMKEAEAKALARASERKE